MMVHLSCVFLSVVALRALSVEGHTHDECPPAAPDSIGICVFDPNVNCLRDDECGGGQKCCEDGCNKICKATVREDTQGSSCPVPQPGTCVQDPDARYCTDDDSCGYLEECCEDGCGQVCKQVYYNAATEIKQIQNIALIALGVLALLITGSF